MAEPIRRYNLCFGPDTDALEIEFEMIRRIYERKHEGLGLFHHFKQAQSLLWPEDDHHRWSDLILKEYLANRITVICGSRDCVAGGTLIPNPITGEEIAIQELFERGIAPTVMTLNGPRKASVPFIHGSGDLFEVICKNGTRFTAAASHVVLTASGFDFVGSLFPGQAICSASPASVSSISEPCLSIHGEDAKHCPEKLPDFQESYLNDSGLCDAQPQLVKGISPEFSPLRGDALGRTQCDWQMDGQGNALGYTHLYQLSDRLSIADCFRLENSKACMGFSLGEETVEPCDRWSRRFCQSFLDYDPVFEPIPKSSPGFSDMLFFACQKYAVAETVVQSIKRVGSGNFYDLTVPGVEHYFAGGAIHHNSGKTRGISKAALIDYYVYPDDTLILMTSTTLRGLELRVWGDIKSLHDRALDRYSWVPGNVVDSKHGVFTDKIDETQTVRDQRKGILCIPVLGSKGEFDGESLKSFAGIKQRRRRWIGDEFQFIPRDALKVLDSLDKGDFKGAFLGNPIAENGKALDAVSEPKCGWGAQGEITKTTTWENKYNGVTINLVGTDSPNFDAATLNRFPYMVDSGDVDRVSKRPGGKDSLEWWSQIMGVRKAGAISNRVLTVAEIEAYGGFKDAIWSGRGEAIKIYSIDAGFGGDECVRTYLEFGDSVENQSVIEFGDQRVIPILLSSEDTPEKQIAKYSKQDCDTLGIPYANVFFDAGMFATLAVEMARELSTEVNAVNFGGTATERPVSVDMFVWDQDKKTRRLKTWYEHVSKFVTELWFVVRLAAQCKQLRGFPRAAAEEFGRRQWIYVSQNRYELETKDDYKLRNGGESPNHADSLVIAVEGARQRGFQIELIPPTGSAKKEEQDWLETELTKHRDFMKKRELVYT